MTDFHGDEAKKKFWKKKIQNGRLRIFNYPNSQYFSHKFQKLVLGLVGLIEAMMWLNLYAWETVQCKLKNRQKNAFFVFLGCFWAYAGQPHNHIGWARSMPFASINPTNPRTNFWNWCNQIFRIDDFE